MKKSSLRQLALTALAGLSFLHAGPLFADLSVNETPALTSVTSLGRIGAQRVSDPAQVFGGTAVQVDGDGNYVYATGNMIAKYNTAGVLLWSQFHTPHSTIVEVQGQQQTQVYDRWQNDQGGIDDVSPEFFTDTGELVSAYAQKIAIDAAGDIYGSFTDFRHRDRSMLTKFDGATGVVEWVTRTQGPHDSSNTSQFVSKVVELLVLPDQSVAVLETGIGTGRFVFTRLVIFASAGNGRNGVVVFKDEVVRLQDGGTGFRNSIGVGMAVAADGDLYYATFEGPAPNPLPEYPDPYPTPNKLVLRKLAAPYTGAPVEVAHDSPAEIIRWMDLEIGPSGKVFVLGTVLQVNRHPILAGFDPDSLAETLNPRKTYSPAVTTGLTSSSWNAEGARLLPTGTAADDSLYLTSSYADFRQYPVLESNFVISNQVESTLKYLSVTKVDGAGAVLWAKYEPGVIALDSFRDSANNLHLVCLKNGVGLVKYSAEGVLQYAEAVPADTGKQGDARRSSGTINGDGDIVVSFPQMLISGGDGRFDAPLAVFANPANQLGGQTIHFEAFPSAIYVGATIPLNATSSRGLPVSFRITAGGSNAEIVGNTLRALEDGVVAVEASQAGDGTVLAAAPVTQLLGIFKKPQIITFKTAATRKLSKNKAENSFRMSASTHSGLKVILKSSNRKIIRIVGNTATILRKGSVKITASQVGNFEFAKATPVVRTVTVE